eukprot:CAMPEP_0183378422 /NCGR_PEP_ID=MMETSP0164_2-20130417/124907_1 /TAXON_ID=221442 /ORGANISM="Coccolithus pelagicus ssp braarudi, Strain PLY182g" /LENGTH=61 /DNA_ID=CAMNT_0025555981 /DNA_START=170 /DNA_END=356 /DNA_ORIENTATION=+
MAAVGATCETYDADYNGYAVYYSQLCPVTCGACETWVPPSVTVLPYAAAVEETDLMFILKQ